MRDAMSRDFYVYLMLQAGSCAAQGVPRRDVTSSTTCSSAAIDDGAGTYDIVGYDHDLEVRATALPPENLADAYHATRTGIRSTRSR